MDSVFAANLYSNPVLLHTQFLSRSMVCHGIHRCVRKLPNNFSSCVIFLPFILFHVLRILSFSFSRLCCAYTPNSVRVQKKSIRHGLVLDIFLMTIFFGISLFVSILAMQFSVSEPFAVLFLFRFLFLDPVVWLSHLPSRSKYECISVAKSVLLVSRK